MEAEGNRTYRSQLTLDVYPIVHDATLDLDAAPVEEPGTGYGSLRAVLETASNRRHEGRFGGSERRGRERVQERRLGTVRVPGDDAHHLSADRVALSAFLAEHLGRLQARVAALGLGDVLKF